MRRGDLAILNEAYFMLATMDLYYAFMFQIELYICK